MKYEGVYKGIDLVIRQSTAAREYDFVVAPGADPHRIQFDVRGAEKIRLRRQGDLILQMSAGEVRWRKPLVYQEKNGTRQEICRTLYRQHKNRVVF